MMIHIQTVELSPSPEPLPSFNKHLEQFFLFLARVCMRLLSEFMLPYKSCFFTGYTIMKLMSHLYYFMSPVMQKTPEFTEITRHPN